LWIENVRLSKLGFVPGMRISVRASGENTLVIEHSDFGGNSISSKRGTPVLDVCSAQKLSLISDFDQVKVSGHYRKLIVTPSVQAFHIRKNRERSGHFRVVEMFCGGGTMSAAMSKDPRFEVVAAVEYDQRFANEYGKVHEGPCLMIGDARRFAVTDYPRFDVLVAGIPCVDFSNLGRAKKSLAGRPESGSQADLFIPVLNLVANRMPRAVVLENVPSFGNSHAGMLVRNFLTNLGYFVHECVFDSHRDFGDIQARKRWCLVATLHPGFAIAPVCSDNLPLAGDFLDAPDPDRDGADADRIEKTIQCLDKRIERHREKGNGFGYSVIDHESSSIPTLTKSMHKINQGPFVRCPDGRLRMLRKHELERIAGHQVASDSFTLTCQIIGQGVSVKAFSHIFRQLGDFLSAPELFADGVKNEICRQSDDVNDAREENKQLTLPIDV